MKLRIRAHTLRLRLTRSEVDAVGRGETVSESTPFPDGSALGYALVCAGDTVTAALERSDGGSRIDVRVPASLAREWALTEAVALGGDSAIAAGPMEILIEKDFDCLAPRAGDENVDTFPHPGPRRTDDG